MKSRFKTRFDIIKNKNGEVVGFSLLAQPQAEAEEFCKTFPRALILGKADIRVEDEEIIFDHPTCFFEGICTHKVNTTDASSLQKILKLKEGKKARKKQKKKLRIEMIGSFSPGFKITI